MSETAGASNEAELPGKNRAEYALRDIAERTNRIERTLTEEEPDAELILHDLKELDTAVAVLGDAAEVEKARALRERATQRFGT